REDLTYEAFGRAVRDLAHEIADDGFRPDIVLAIARGGLLIAGGLSYVLGVKNVHLVSVEFYTGVGETLPLPVLLPPVPNAVDLREKRVLVVDDVADSGHTLRLVHDFCRDHVAELRTAVIYEKARSVVRCEYVWRRTDAWINFPWSVEPPVVQRAGQVLDA
ncbi:MAG TPA: phosphoribosyltransferase, partial [Angustibacter sp.]|nr:phosphoribosyltransferase [Angustibacter sp.]